MDQPRAFDTISRTPKHGVCQIDGRDLAPGSDGSLEQWEVETCAAAQLQDVVAPLQAQRYGPSTVREFTKADEVVQVGGHVVVARAPAIQIAQANLIALLSTIAPARLLPMGGLPAAGLIQAPSEIRRGQ